MGTDLMDEDQMLEGLRAAAFCRNLGAVMHDYQQKYGFEAWDKVVREMQRKGGGEAGLSHKTLERLKSVGYKSVYDLETVQSLLKIIKDDKHTTRVP